MSRFRLWATKPTTVALIFTPLQAINLLEYAETTGSELALILVGNSPHARNREQIAEVLAGAAANVVHIRGYSGVPRPGPRQDAALAEILFHLSAVEGTIRMVFGEYRSSLAWRLVHTLSLFGDRVVFLDDGAATLSIDRGNRANDSVPWDSNTAVAPTYQSGIHLVTKPSYTAVGPYSGASQIRVLAEGERIEVITVIHRGDRLWGIDREGEFIRMGDVLWHAPLPDGMKAKSEVDPQGGTEWVSDPNFSTVPAVTFFTSYSKELRAGAGDRVIANAFPRLKRLYRDLQVDPNRVIVIGSPLKVIGLTPDRLREYTLELLTLVQVARPNAEIVYVPHRAESDDDIGYLAGVCAVERFDIPFELVPLRVGYLPGLCATFYSSLSLNLLDLAGDRLSILSLRINPDDYDESRRETVERVYERIASHPSGATQVVASEPGYA